MTATKTAHAPKVTTKTGDTGFTGLLGSIRVPKEDARIEALGAVDEVTSAFGLARAWCEDPYLSGILLHLQRDLYVLMADLATPEENRRAIGIQVTAEHVEWLETTQTALLAAIEIPGEFIVPGASRDGAVLDFARAVVRRAERAVARLIHHGLIENLEVLRYLNRLSDFVFVLARTADASVGGSTLAKS